MRIAACRSSFVTSPYQYTHLEGRHGLEEFCGREETGIGGAAQREEAGHDEIWMI